MAFKLNTLHIFGYGECQVIGQNGDIPVNKKAPTADCSGSLAVVNNVYSFKPSGSLAPNEYHAINIFDDMFADYQPKGEFPSWRTEWAELDSAAITTLVAEVLAHD